MNKLLVVLFIGFSVTANAYDVPNVETETEVLRGDDVAPILIDRSYNRPKSCPLKSQTYSDIRAKLIRLHTLLKNGQCAKQNPGIMDSMDTMLKSGMLNRVYPGGGLPPTPSSQTEILRVLEGITNVEECVEDIKQGGLLSELADISVTLGQLAFVVPGTPNGAIAGVLGLGLGTAIRVLQNIFKKTFDWSEPTDREQFLNLNCSFFDMRREIEATQLLLPVDPTLSGKVIYVEKALKKVSAKTVGIKNRKVDFIKAIEAKKKEYVIDNLLLANDLLNTTNKILERVKDFGDHPYQVSIIAAYMESSGVWLGQIGSVRDAPQYIYFLKELMSELHWGNLQHFVAMNRLVFENEYQHPLASLMTDLQTYLTGLKTDLENEFDETLVPDTETTYKQYVKDTTKLFDQIDSKLSDAVGQITIRLQILKSRSHKDTFNPTDEGTYVTFDILDRYEQIQKSIYGTMGYSFLKFMREHLTEKNEDFAKGLKEFNKNYTYYPEPPTLEWSCRDANNLKLLWESADMASEITYDFVAANSGLWHSNIEKYKKLFKIPYAKNKQYVLYQYVKSIMSVVEEYRTPELLAGVKSIFQKKSFAELISKVKDTQAQRGKLEQFIQRNSCGDFY